MIPLFFIADCPELDDSYPVYVLEPTVVLQAVVRPAVTALRVQAQHSLDYLLCSPVFEIAREAWVSLDDLLVDLVRVLGHCTEGELADHEFVKHHPYRP